MIEVKRQNVNCEDITADNMLMEDSQCKDCQELDCQCKSQKNIHKTRWLSKNRLHAGSFSCYHDHAPVMFFVMRAISLSVLC